MSLALTAFDEVPLKEATAFVRTNRPNPEDLAWAFTHSGSSEGFEERLRERLAQAKQDPGRGGGRQGSSETRKPR